MQISFFYLISPRDSLKSLKTYLHCEDAKMQNQNINNFIFSVFGS